MEFRPCVLDPSVPVPCTADKGATLQIWHSSHGRFETQAPIRTFVPYSISGKDYVLAAYTCTPLVKIPFSDLKPGAQVKGAEIADLGAGNQPVDMVPYKKNGHDYILIPEHQLWRREAEGRTIWRAIRKSPRPSAPTSPACRTTKSRPSPT